MNNIIKFTLTCAMLAVANTALAGQLCDFDADNGCDIDDIDLLVAAVVAATTDLYFDLNHDGVVTVADIHDPDDGWLSQAGELNLGPGRAYLEGDANLDGIVDGPDFINWNTNKFTNTAKWSLADFDASGTTDGVDFLLWNMFKFQSANDVAAVPEPTTALSLVLAILAVVGFRTRLHTHV